MALPVLRTAWSHYSCRPMKAQKAQQHLLAPQPATRAQIIAAVLGLVLVVAGVVAVAVNSSFDTGSALRSDEVLGFAVNGWDALVLTLGLGLLLLIGALRRKWAR